MKRSISAAVTSGMGDERSLAKEFSLLAPSRRRIPVQRWTTRRLALTGALLSGIAIALATTFELMASNRVRPLTQESLRPSPP
jgi:hypothetical protein